MKPKAYSYTRMSTAVQLLGDSKRRQDERVRKYAEANGLDIVDRFDDIGISAFQGKNADVGALSEFTQLVDSGDIEAGSYLLVESMDRLTRQAAPRAMSLLLGLMGRGIKVAILDENRVYSNQGGEEETFDLMGALLSMSRAHEESRRKSTMIAAAWENKRRLARAEGKVTTSKVPGWLCVRNGKIEVVEERAKIVRRIFALTAGGFGAYSIAKLLNTEGFKPWSTRKHAVWRESYIKKIIASRTVLGEYQPHRVVRSEKGLVRMAEGEPLREYYPRVVSNLQFQEANEAAAARSSVGRGRKGAAYSNLFTGLLRCQCGAGFRFIDKGKPPRGGKYLQCSVAFIKGNCHQPRIRYRIMEELLLQVLDSLDIGVVLGVGAERERLRALKSERADLIELQRTVANELNNLVSALRHGAPESIVLAREVAKLEQVLEENKAGLAVVEFSIQSIETVDPIKHRLQLDELLAKLASTGQAELLETRRALAGEVQRLLRRIVVRANGFIAWELADESLNWQEVYGVDSISELEQLCNERSFEVTIVYRSGEILIVDSLMGPYFNSKKGIRMKTLEHLAGESVSQK